MNERIKELWSQAGGNYDRGNQHTWPQYTIDSPEKFAELVIKECVKACGSQVDKVNILKAFGLPVESNIKYSATPPKWSKESQYKREYNIRKTDEI